MIVKRTHTPHEVEAGSHIFHGQFIAQKLADKRDENASNILFGLSLMRDWDNKITDSQISVLVETNYFNGVSRETFDKALQALIDTQLVVKTDNGVMISPCLTHYDGVTDDELQALANHYESFGGADLINEEFTKEYEKVKQHASKQGVTVKKCLPLE